MDRAGQVYFVDMVSGIWKLDVRGARTHIPGPAFHWMALDAGDQLRGAPLPSGQGGEVARIGAEPRVILASDYPITVGEDGSLYFPTHDSSTPVRIMKMLPSGKTEVVTTIPAAADGTAVRYLNGLAAGPGGSLYYTESNAIRRVSKEGRVSTVAQNVTPSPCGSVPGMGPGDRPLMQGLAVDSGGTAYVAATACGSVLRITPDGRVAVLFQTETPWSPTGIALRGNDVYVLEFLGAASDDRREMMPRVRKIDPDGTSRVVATVSRQ